MSIRTVDQTIISPSTVPVTSHNIQRTHSVYVPSMFSVKVSLY